MSIPIIIFCIAVLVRFGNAQGTCEDGSCYPTIGDLVVGRSKHLSASSTCGQDEPQRYCIISYLEDDQKCFTCDSRYPYNPYTYPNSHQIENVITAFDSDWKKRWWQSENGINYVSIRLDLETLFQFSHLVLTFKSFRPAAMLVERSRDFGKTWKVFKYFAQNCASDFPGISEGHADDVGDVVCDSRYSDMEPSTEGEVVLKALDPSFDIDDPYDPYIQDIITLTNLRINFTKLHTFGDTHSNGWQREPQEKYYYALYEMIVRGNCFCNGHASQCVPIDDTRGDVFSQPGMVHGKCVCQHNTDGLNCEKCKEFYNDAPWRPAVGFEDNACKKCSCNGHSDKCHFEMKVYQANNGTSGGVCDNCQHNTVGNQCEFCKPFFYHDPLKDISDPNTCIPCDCDPDGTHGGGICEGYTNRRLGILAGTCLCKQNVEGIRCDQCKPGYFGISASNILGCQYCGCNQFGTLPSSVCDAVTGQCQCNKFATGQYCDECIPGFWGLGNSLYPCSACNCDIGGAHSIVCSQSTGQCDCLPNIVGLWCNQPADGYYFIPLDYYIYEAEKAQALSGSATIVNPTPMPKCKEYFLKQGIDFRFENDRIILKSMRKRNIRGRRQAEEVDTSGAEGVVELVLRQPTPGKPVTWTGPGFARVLHGAGLRFTVNNIPYSMDFILALRYEPESLEDWTARIMINLPHGEFSEHCKNNQPLPEGYTVQMLATNRIALLNTSVCLDPDREYLIDVYFSQISNTHSSKQYILIDSLGLIPQISSLSNFCTEEQLEEYDYYNCIEIATDIGTEILPDVCEKLIISMSARIHNGAVKCSCNSQGSINNRCNKIGGQCQCKPNVVGSCCDRCAVGSYGFGASGCLGCDCHINGSMSTLCDQITGQCACRKDTQGRRCDRCLPGYYGFPNCRPCQCNGNSDSCDPITGACKSCKEFATGTNCERCLENYFGNPSKGQPCRPCMCPGPPTGNQYFAHSCEQNPDTLEVTCKCKEGYTGKNCNDCPAGSYGKMEGEGCFPCKCNKNIDKTDPDACDKVTGECLKCLYNTYGPKCESCIAGYFGSGRHQNCTSCDCHVKGSISTLCDQVTGQCTCHKDIQGRRCDNCLPGYFGFPNCRPCDCNGNSELCDPITGACKICKGFTTGINCERCLDNYFGNPLKGQPCRQCLCPGPPTGNQYYAKSCQQNPDTLEVTCNCLKGYTGQNCNECPVGFYGNLEEGEGCLPCQCNNNIDKTDPEACDKVTGECLKCLNNTYGPKCEFCTPGYFGSGRHQNCTSCICNSIGTKAENCLTYEEVGECGCDRTTGQCPCLPNVIGIKCDTCAPGNWNFSSGKGCQPCNCYPNNSKGNQCNPLTGQCQCKPRYKGKKCDQCEENHYGNPKVQCIPCRCNLDGTQKPMCDKDTGACNCKVGVTGRQCDQCAPKFKQEFPSCPRCHMCFDQYEPDVLFLVNSVHDLVRLAANIGPTRSPMGCDVQMSILQDKLSAIGKIFKSQIISPDKYAKVKAFYDTIRQKVNKIRILDLGKFNEIPRLNQTIVDMEKNIDDLFKDLDIIRKKKQKENIVKVKDIQASFDKITKHYKTSLSAAEKARNAAPSIRTASKTRKSILTALSNLDIKDKQNFEKLNKMKSLQISKMNEMVCGTIWDFPCDISPCGGALCKDKFGRRKCGGPDCNGALPIAKDGLKKANETSAKLRSVAINLLEAEKQIQHMRQLAEDTKLKASRLNKTLSKSLSRIETDKSRSKELIKNVKDFLLDSIPVCQCQEKKTMSGRFQKPQDVDATINPEEIEKIANEILAIKLPAAPYDLINMLKKIKQMCDEYQQNKKNLQNQLENVKKLTQQANNAKKAVENLPSGYDIRNNLNQAENIQKKTSSVLKNVNKNIQDIRNRLSQAKSKADMTDKRFNEIKDLHSQLEAKIAELQEKMLQNRNMAAKAEKGAKSALQEAAESENSLNNLKETYEVLKEKMKKRDIPPEVLDRLQQLKKDAEDFAKEIDDKFNRIADLEDRIDDLNRKNEEKANQLIQLEKKAIELKDSILAEENKQATCNE